MKNVIQRLPLILVLGGFGFSAIGADAQPSAKLTFVRFGDRFDVSRTDGSGMSVVLNLTNTSDKPFAYTRNGCLPTVLGCFLSEGPTGQVVWS